VGLSVFANRLVDPLCPTHTNNSSRSRFRHQFCTNPAAGGAGAPTFEQHSPPPWCAGQEPGL
jgi:hypothetical protein